MTGPVDDLQRSSGADHQRAERVRRSGYAAFSVAVMVVVGALSFAVASVSAVDDLRWVTGVVLVVLLAATGGLCAHAGGHAWFVPLPALVLGVLWAVTASGHDAGRASWWLVAMSAAAAGIAVAVGSSALQQRLRNPAPVPWSPEGASGTAVTPLSPVGVVRVAGETWTANSLSGPLPAGVPVHVVRINGVRLDVWSEAGRVPDHRSLDSGEEYP